MNAPVEPGLMQATEVLQRFRTVRARSLALAAPLSPEDACVQSMPDASPIKWHLAHTSWFFETFILEAREAGFQPHHPAFRVLFNSYYNGIGEKHARANRGLITRPALDEILAYRHAIDRRIADLLAAPSPHLIALITLGLQHEQQHQELMLTDLKHLLSMNPLQPAYAADAIAPPVNPAPSRWQQFDAALTEIGYDGAGFCFDNELPRHRQFVEAFALASTLVTNGEYLEFITAGGYQDAALWLSEGWDWIKREALSCPLYWRDNAGWQEFTLRGVQALDLQAPVAHLSYFEADAYARWAGARLPTEAEWEHAAQSADFADLFGACWQWTSSSYTPYPGFATADGALGEYNGKFMVNQYVLRGGSCATPDGHARTSYRNFFPATARWQFSGLRLARS
ncbi:ergothioneine biosynthesis protein EgtB [Actimicrobium sp. GrIS 1.19]|uniref:ergothioneine biosynthesis protein EgtB n=1 Tax=Actimicrobium sp. GrIS 1.19 TaxID=3071708 RepID=UPI002E02BEF7|nr:ergothioneine biosynthesis protein EgtB [Actimicrobium sp. GrIS 1.19]